MSSFEQQDQQTQSQTNVGGDMNSIHQSRVGDLLESQGVVIGDDNTQNINYYTIDKTSEDASQTTENSIEPRLTNGWLYRLLYPLLFLFQSWLYEKLYIDSVRREFREWQQLYAPLDTSVQEATPGNSMQIDIRGPKRDLLTSITDYNRVLLIGEGGAGKTTFLKRFILQYTQRHQVWIPKRSRLILPVYLSLNDVSLLNADELIELIRQKIADYERSHWMDHFFPIEKAKIQERIERLLGEGRIILLLDGLDEVSRNTTAQTLSTLDEFSRIQKYLASTVILSSRPGNHLAIFENTIDNLIIRPLIIRPLADASMVELLQLRGLSPDFVLRQLESIKLRDICRNPNILVMFADQYKRPNYELPLSRGHIFKGYVKALLQDGQKKWSHTIEASWMYHDIVSDTLSNVAFTMLENGLQTFPLAKLNELTLKIAHTKQVVEQARLCKLILFNQSRTEIHFQHELLRSYFAAEIIEQRLLHHIHHLVLIERWWDAILLQADMTSQPLALVQSILADIHDEHLIIGYGCILIIMLSREKLSDDDFLKLRELQNDLEKKIVQLLQPNQDFRKLHHLCLHVARIVGNPFTQEFVRLIDQHNDMDPQSHEFVIKLLIAIESSLSVDYLLNKLKDGDKRIQRTIQHGLGEFASSYSLSKEQISTLLQLVGNNIL